MQLAIAKPAGVDDEGRRLYLKDGKLLTDDELLAAVEKDYADEAEDVAFELAFAARRLDDGSRSDDPEMLDYLRSIKAVDDDADSVDGVTADSAKLYFRALEILNEQGKEDDYSANEYVLAVEKAQEARDMKTRRPIWGGELALTSDATSRMGRSATAKRELVPGRRYRADSFSGRDLAERFVSFVAPRFSSARPRLPELGCQARQAGGGVTVTTTSGWPGATGGQLATRCSCRPTATASRREWTLSAFRMWRMWLRTVSMLRWSSCAI
jgi:hypothetical protein